MALNLQTAFLSPPVAMAAFYLKGVSPPHVTLNQIFAGMMPFMGIQVVALVLLYMFPGSGCGCRRCSTSSACRPRCAAARVRGSNLTGRRRVATTSTGGAMLVSEILRIKGTTLFTTTPDAPVLDAVKVMAQHDIGSLVVMDHGRMVGHRHVRRSAARAGRARRHARRRQDQRDHRARSADRDAARST